MGFINVNFLIILKVLNKKRRQIALPSDLFIQLVIHTANTDFVLTEKFLEEENNLEEEACDAALMALATAIF